LSPPPPSSFASIKQASPGSPGKWPLIHREKERRERERDGPLKVPHRRPLEIVGAR